MITAVRRLTRVAPPPRAELALSVALGALAVVFGIGLMTSAGYLIARAAEQPAILSLSTVIVAVRFFGLARPLARYLERLTSHDVAFRVLAGLRSRFYARIEPLAPGQLDAYRRGDLVGRMVGDVDALQGLYLRGVGPPFVALVAGAIAVGTALAVLPPAGLALAVGLVVAAVVVPVVSSALVRRTGRRRAAAQGELTAELVELLRGAPELAVYGRIDDALERLRLRDDAVARITRRDAFSTGVADALGVMVAGVTTVAVLALAVDAHAAGDLDRTLLAALTLLALASFEAVAPLPQAARELSSTIAAGDRVLEIVDREPTIRDPAEPESLGAGRPTVALESVTAAYADGAPVFAALDLRLDPGERLAIVGASGAGKTTVVNLLLRFLDPVAGRVTIDGHDLRTLRQEDVRRTFAVVGQDAHLFSTSIAENVRLARPGASDADIEQALRRARVWDWVESLPEGVGTFVGEEGAELSGGQRQRVVLARALLADAPVVVLDEPTAHLDPETAEALMRDLLETTEGKSVLLITHRPEGLDRVDRIVTIGG